MSASPFDEDFDWFAFLDRDPSTLDGFEIGKAYNLACEWVTCACGQLCKALPRSKDGEPVDDTLRDLGMSFTTKFSDMCILGIAEDKWERAKELLLQIENRTAELLSKRQ